MTTFPLSTDPLTFALVHNHVLDPHWKPHWPEWTGRISTAAFTGRPMLKKIAHTVSPERPENWQTAFQGQ
ncbi:MAG: hypothetical protein KGK00_14605 [Paracoccaceae bacterium]|nr:hypothetical protein [Paracoccaceae bacterium]